MEKDEKVIYPELSYKIVGCLFEVYNQLGSNHRENLYQQALSREFNRSEIEYIEQFLIDVNYKGEKIGKVLLDFLIADKIILEIKSAAFIKKQDFKQLLDYLKISGKKLGIITAFTAKGVKFYRVLNDL